MLFDTRMIVYQTRARREDELARKTPVCANAGGAARYFLLHDVKEHFAMYSSLQFEMQ